jgi:hypothetical protein
MVMDPVSRFLSALALSSVSITSIGAAQAQESDELNLYRSCVNGNSASCAAFLSQYPNSALASDVLAHAFDRWQGGGGGPSLRPNIY